LIGALASAVTSLEMFFLAQSVFRLLIIAGFPWNSALDYYRNAANPVLAFVVTPIAVFSLAPAFAIGASTSVRPVANQIARLIIYMTIGDLFGWLVVFIARPPEFPMFALLSLSGLLAVLFYLVTDRSKSEASNEFPFLDSQKHPLFMIAYIIVLAFFALFLNFPITLLENSFTLAFLTVPVGFAASVLAGGVMIVQNRSSSEVPDGLTFARSIKLSSFGGFVAILAAVIAGRETILPIFGVALITAAPALGIGLGQRWLFKKTR
jgi:hypothetical protein